MAFVLDSEGKIVVAFTSEVENGDQVITKARELAVHNAMELWQPPVRRGSVQPKE